MSTQTRQQEGPSPEELLRKDVYTPEELATLLDMDLNAIRQAAFAGRLKAKIIEHDIISIRREDAIAWLRDQE